MKLWTTRIPSHRQQQQALPLMVITPSRKKWHKNFTLSFSAKKNRKCFPRHGWSRDFISPSVQISVLDSFKTMVVRVVRLLSCKHTCWTICFVRRSPIGKIRVKTYAQLHFDMLYVRRFLTLSNNVNPMKHIHRYDSVASWYKSWTLRGCD